MPLLENRRQGRWHDEGEPKGRFEGQEVCGQRQGEQGFPADTLE